MNETPVSKRCEEILKKREHVLIGISPLNSYYSEDRITKLIHWGHTSFKEFHILTADTLSEYNFLAVGYPLKKAKKKTRQNWNSLYNKITRAFQSIGMTEETYQKKIIALSGKLPENNIYKKLHDVCLERYKQDEAFRQKCMESSKMVLENYGGAVVDSSLDIAINYLLGELPFYLDTPRMLNVNSSLLVYHKAIPFFTDIYQDREKNLIADTQGHLILEI
ncbi:Cyclodipeptide synthase [Gammaproteobacteria bacterium]